MSEGDVSPSTSAEVEKADTEKASPGWPELLAALVARRDLTSEETAWAMGQVMSGSAAPEQLAGFLIGLRAKGETVAEVDGLVSAMLDHAVRLDLPGAALDLVGTGGDRANTVNISTMAAIVVASTGRRVIKHGNRAASSASGTADVLEALGVRLDATPERVAALADKVGITFCFAQAFHPSMRFAGPVRRSLAVPTVFNFLGPLANPAQPPAMALGVFDAAMAPVMAGVLARRGVSALVFRGEDGLDELSTSAPSQIWVVAAGRVHEMRLDAVDLGLDRAPLSALVGGNAEHNAQVVTELLAGASGPVRDAVLLNAAAGIVAYDGLADLQDDALVVSRQVTLRLQAALVEARKAIDSGAAAALLARWVTASGEPEQTPPAQVDPAPARV